MRPKHPLIAVALVTLLLLVPLPLGSLARNWFALTNTIENFAHPLMFWWLTAHLFPAVRTRCPSNLTAYGLTLALSVGLGLALEYFQSLVGRDASWEDARNDAVGTLLALALQARRDPGCAGARPWRPVATLAAIALAVMAAFPMMWTTAAYIGRWVNFPVIWSADSRLAHRFSYWKQDAFPGLVIDEPARDWRGYTALQVKVQSLRSNGTEIRIRVHDQQHNQEFLDRYDQAFVLPDSRERTLTIPLAAIQHGPAARHLDLSAVRGLIIFQEGAREPPRFAVGEIRLVR
jgi:VanZ family protein